MNFEKIQNFGSFLHFCNFVIFQPTIVIIVIIIIQMHQQGMKKCNGCQAKVTARLSCPTCRSLGVSQELSFFCSQECFQSSWDTHKLVHQVTRKTQSSDKVVSQLHSKLSEAEWRERGLKKEVLQLQEVIDRLNAKMMTLQNHHGSANGISSSPPTLSTVLVEPDEKGWRDKVDLAEKEAEAAVKLLKSKDLLIEEQEEAIAEWKSKCDELEYQIKSLNDDLLGMSDEFTELNQKYERELKEREDAVRLEVESKCQSQV